VELLGACRSLPQQWQLSLCNREVSFHIAFFEACSTFTRVTARTLAESLNDPFHRRLQTGRCLPACSDCYRLERPLPEGTCTLSRTVPFHGTRLRPRLQSALRATSWIGLPGNEVPVDGVVFEDQHSSSCSGILLSSDDLRKMIMVQGYDHDGHGAFLACNCRSKTDATER